MTTWEPAGEPLYPAPPPPPQSPPPGTPLLPGPPGSEPALAETGPPLLPGPPSSPFAPPDAASGAPPTGPPPATPPLFAPPPAPPTSPLPAPPNVAPTEPMFAPSMPGSPGLGDAPPEPPEPGSRRRLVVLLSLLGLAIVAAAVTVVIVLLIRDADDSGAPGPEGTTGLEGPRRSIPAGPEGTKRYEDLSKYHVEGVVEYAQTPPVGGDHAPVWRNCGAYSEPIPVEEAVHSLEHGAVWITYSSELAADARDELEGLADPYGFVLVSPWDDRRGDLPAPVVASAWGVQLTLGDAADPRLSEFVETFAAGPQTPEPGAPCTGGEGSPG